MSELMSICCSVGKILLEVIVWVGFIVVVCNAVTSLKGKKIANFCGSIFLACVFGFVFWSIHGETIPNWILSSDGMFGKDIGGYEQKFLDEQYPSKYKDDRLVDCWKWEFRKGNGVYIVPIRVPKPLSYFSEYSLHLMPISKRSYLISGNRFDALRMDYETVKDLLVAKYGNPIEETEDMCSFMDGKKKVGLVYTKILGRPQLYINAYRTDLQNKNLQKEIHEYEKLQLKNKERRRQEEMDRL